MKRIITVTLILFCITYLSAKDIRKKKTRQWSKYQGQMNWYNAKVKCKTLGMRLPTIKEFQTAYKVKALESWKRDWYESGYSLYWTSKEGEEGIFKKAYAYLFSVDIGIIGNSAKYGDIHLRCIR
jgi:hypothetical protein